MTLVEIHSTLAQTVLLFSLGLSAWAFYLYFRQRGPDSSFLGGMVIGELLFAAQGILGGALFFSGRPLAQWVHVLYGATGVIALPAAYFYLRGEGGRRASLVYGVVGLFMFGLALRAITTG